MEPYLDSKEEEYEETIQTKYPLHKYQQNPQKNSVNYSYQNYLKTNKNSPKWKEKINQYKTINFNTQNSKKQYNNYSYSSQNDEPRNSAKYYSHNNKYLTLFNSKTRRYEPSNATVSIDGVLRGYTDNCSFYVSGSSELRPKISIKNKLNNNNNKNQIYNKYNKNNQIENRKGIQNRIYESKTQIIDPSNYITKEVKKDTTNKFIKRNENKNYSSKTNINNRVYTINENNNNYEKKNYQASALNKNIIKNSDKKSSKYYSRRSYFETDPSNTIKYSNNKIEYTNSFRKPIIPSKIIYNREPKPTIKNINNTSNNANKRRIYKTSTDTNLKNKNNYYKIIIDKKSHKNNKRNNTPNISTRVENRENNTLIHYITSDKEEPSKKFPNRNNYKSVIPYNKGHKFKNNSVLEENIFTKTEKNYQPMWTLNKKNSNTNIHEIQNKNRYNFPEKPKLREYGTKTEIHSINNNYNRLFLNYREREKKYSENNKITNYSGKFNKIEPKNMYNTRSTSITLPSRNEKKYGVRTETIAMNNKRYYSRNNEYEETQIKSFKKQDKKKRNYSVEKNPKMIEPLNNFKKILNNKKEYSAFERSLNNIKENEKQIEKTQKNNSKLKQNSSNNHITFISNYSKDKKIYKTSTQTQYFRPHEYILSYMNEYEVPNPKKNMKKLKKIKVNILIKAIKIKIFLNIIILTKIITLII